MEKNLYGYEIKKEIVEKFKEYVDIKFGSIYYAIRKAVNNEWVMRVGSEKDGSNPERYIYQIMPYGRKQFKKLLRQYFEKNMIHFEIDFIVMFYNLLSQEQKDRFIEDRIEVVKNHLIEVKEKVDKESKVAPEVSHFHMFSYLENHLKAELFWLKSLKRA